MSTRKPEFEINATGDTITYDGASFFKAAKGPRPTPVVRTARRKKRREARAARRNNRA